jgi:hypothetical protein
MTVEFDLEGQRFVAINGGQEFTFNEALSPEAGARRRTRSTGTGSDSPPTEASRGRAGGSRTALASPGR